MGEPSDNLWSELRALFNSPPTHNAFLQLLELLQLYPEQSEQDSIREYVGSHLKAWEKPLRTGWNGDFLHGLTWLAPHCRVLQPLTFTKTPITSCVPSIQFDTPCGIVVLQPRSQGIHSELPLHYSGCGSSTQDITVYVWETSECRIELEVVSLSSLPATRIDFIDDGFLATWSVHAYAQLEKMFLTHSCACHDPVENDSACGERFDALEWYGQPLGVDRDGHTIREHLCVGTHDTPAMRAYAGSWWPSEQESCVHLNFKQNMLEIELPQLSQGQSCVIRSAGSWGRYSEELVEAWLLTDTLLTCRDLPQQAT